MKHELKPGDPVMVEGIYVEGFEFNVLIEAKYLKVNIDRIHPIPTPPRPLRVDELEVGKEYEFNSHDEGRIQGKYVTTVGTHAIMAIRYKWRNADDPCVVSESQNIRPVERVVTKEEVWNYFCSSCEKLERSDAIYATVRHFMKGGEKP